MKSVTYSDAIRRMPQYLALARETTDRLQGILTPSGERASAEWDLSTDERGTPLLSLRVWDDMKGEAETRFVPDKMKDSTGLRSQLLRLWGDLLQKRSHKQLEDLMDPGSGD